MIQRGRGSVQRLLLGISLGCMGAPGCAGGGDVASPNGQVCATVGCTSSVTYSGTLTVAAADLPRLEILLCRNDVCATTRVAMQDSAVWRATIVGPLGGPLGGPLSSTSGSMSSSYVVLAGLDDLRKLSIVLYGTAATLSDGDRYQIRIGLPGQAPLLDLVRTVSYEVVRPDGADCDLVCKKAVLS